MNIDRLSKLKLMLLNISDMPVRQGFYFKSRGKITNFANRIIDKMDPFHFSLATWRSGTAACAFTHACYRYEFEGEGLSFDVTTNLPRYDGEIGVFAAEKFFDINEEESRYLFSDRSYKERENTSPVDVYMRLCDLMICKDEIARNNLIFQTSHLMHYKWAREAEKSRLADMANKIRTSNSESGTFVVEV